MIGIRSTIACTGHIDWRTALRFYRELLKPGLLVGGGSAYQARLQRLLNGKWKGRDCCLAYIKTH